MPSTSELQAVEQFKRDLLTMAQRISVLQTRIEEHTSLVPGESGKDYPHPAQLVRSITFARNLRLDDFLKAPTDGQVLSADSAQSGKLAWQTLVASGIAWRVLTPPQITADQDDYTPTGYAASDWWRLNTDATRSITGMIAGTDGQIRVTHNVGANNVVFVDESASSTAANRFAVLADVTLGPDDACIWQYDATSARWRAISRTGLATGTATPSADSGAGSAGTSAFASHEDHVHPLSASGWAPTVVAKTAAYNAVANDFVLANATGGPFAVTLPAAASNANSVISVKKTDSTANAVTISRTGADTIDGAASQSIATQYEELNFISDGTNWWIF